MWFIEHKAKDGEWRPVRDGNGDLIRWSCIEAAQGAWRLWTKQSGNVFRVTQF